MDATQNGYVATIIIVSKLWATENCQKQKLHFSSLNFKKNVKFCCRSHPAYQNCWIISKCTFCRSNHSSLTEAKLILTKKFAVSKKFAVWDHIQTSYILFFFGSSTKSSVDFRIFHFFDSNCLSCVDLVMLCIASYTNLSVRMIRH